MEAVSGSFYLTVMRISGKMYFPLLPSHWRGIDSLWLYLKNETEFFSKKLKVLHFAPEQAFYKRFRNLSNLDYTTTDLNSPLADVKADICDLPFKNESFDFILCNHVLEHIPDDKKAMQELYRILKPGGTAILQIPQELDQSRNFSG